MSRTGSLRAEIFQAVRRCYNLQPMAKSFEMLRALYDCCSFSFQDEACHYNPSTRGANVTGYVVLPEGDEDTLQKAVASIGPISIGIDAGHASFHSYHEGVQ